MLFVDPSKKSYADYLFWTSAIYVLFWLLIPDKILGYLCFSETYKFLKQMN